jgi:hypothetical protein
MSKFKNQIQKSMSNFNEFFFVIDIAIVIAIDVTIFVTLH